MLNKSKRKKEKEVRIIMSIIKKKKCRLPLFSPHRTQLLKTIKGFSSDKNPQTLNAVHTLREDEK